jgi:dTDP-glucose 4,6-dehydratase
MSAILITGGAGFIGANFVRHWRASYPETEIVVLDALTYAGNKQSLEGIDGVEFVTGNICDYTLVQSLLADRRIDRLVNFAAETHVDRSIHGPDLFVETNITGTLALLKAAKAVWLDTGSGKPHRFHHISTDEVFGNLGPDQPEFCETTPFAPNSPYSASKAGSDHLVRAYHQTYALDVSTTNCSNNYGPYQYPEKLIPLFLINALHGRPLPIYGDGLQRRDWLHVADHCLAIDKVLASGRSGETYVVGGNAETPNMELIDSLCTALDSVFAQDPQLESRFPDAPAGQGKPTASLKSYVKDRAGHDRRYAINPAKIADELGFAPRHSLSTGIGETVQWYLDNEHWWRPILAKGQPGMAIDQ